MTKYSTFLHTGNSVQIRQFSLSHYKNSKYRGQRSNFEIMLCMGPLSSHVEVLKINNMYCILFKKLAATREYHGIYIHIGVGSRDAWRHYDSRELFLVSPGFPERPVNTRYWQGKFPSKSQFAETMWRHSLLMPPVNKTKNKGTTVR